VLTDGVNSAMRIVQQHFFDEEKHQLTELVLGGYSIEPANQQLV
jgi:hypothetical protein